MDLIAQKCTGNLLIICENSASSEATQFKALANSSIKLIDEILGQGEPSRHYETIILQAPDDKIIGTKILTHIFKLGKAGAKVIMWSTHNDNVEFALKTTGFTGVGRDQNNLIATKPNYEIGSSAKLNFGGDKKTPTVWKLDDDDDEDEIIDPDDLLDEDDLKKPDPATLKVCGTTGKRKACRDCSCGLADELLAVAQSGKVVDTTDKPKSSCGSCYLGDAFRCATCPYLGMPAFKPGEKIQLSDNFLADDL